MSQYLLWVGFIVFIVGMLVLDLKVFQKKDHEATVREDLLWTLFWIILALIFNVGIYYFMGHTKALEFLTGYLIEKSLSVDNISVFILVFSYFGTPAKYQHKILFWGILGALVMRALFIFAGITLIHNLHWIIYVFGVFLVYIGIRMAFEKEKEIHPEKNMVIRIVKKIIPVKNDTGDGDFFIKEAGKIMATPLFIVLIMIESTDVVFAVDSIPAILSITLDPFIVYTSNVFAILGLRALYFALSSVMKMFHFLNYGLSAILVFVGVKMLIADFLILPVSMALGVIGGVLVVSILASVLFPQNVEK
ncbi:MAG: TerC family protein [Chrysiogenales bacterium]|nr:MAG: TerC family protein [Chrysiogenales bacterium]